MADLDSKNEPGDTCPENPEQSNCEDSPSLSKNKLKRLRKLENREKFRQEKRLKERERKKANRRAALDRGETLPPSRKVLKRNKMKDSKCNVKVVIDCSFDQLMDEKDTMKFCQQICHSYASNRRAGDPLQFYVAGMKGKTKERMDKIGDYSSWDIYFKDKTYLEEFDKENIIYLSSDSSNVIQSLEDDKVYVIGGLVDHNHHKGLCHRLAEEKGVAHGRLPIADYLDMKTRNVLTVNQVFDILLHFTESRDWQHAFFTAIPKRKGHIKKTQDEKEDLSERDQSSTYVTTDIVENSVKPSS